MNLAKFEKLLVTSPFRDVVFEILEAPIIFHRLRIPRNAVCLELGAGKGLASKKLLRRYRIKRVFVTDPDPEMLKSAKKFIGENKKVVYRLEDATKLSFKKGCFDCVFALGILHHIKDYEKTVREVFRVLKPRGIFVVQDYLSGLYLFPYHKISCYKKIFPHERLLSKRELIETLKKNRFKVEVKFSLFNYYIVLIAIKSKTKA